MNDHHASPESYAMGLAIEQVGEAVVITDPKGSIQYVNSDVAVKRDVSERNAEEETQRFLGAILASCDDAIIGKALDGTIRTWNKGAEGIFGYRADEVMGKSISVLSSRDQPDGTPRVLETIQVWESCHFETTLMTKSGRAIDVLVTGFRLRMRKEILPVRPLWRTTLALGDRCKKLCAKAKEDIGLFSKLHEMLCWLPMPKQGCWWTRTARL
jgi:PAS domain S-box-containing protein